MKCCSASRTLTFLLMNASRWPRRWQNCTRADALAAHYAGFGLADPTTDRLVPALAFARLLTFTPVEATPGALHTLTGAGWSLRGIVTTGAAGSLCQLPEPTAAGPAGAQP